MLQVKVDEVFGLWNGTIGQQVARLRHRGSHTVRDEAAKVPAYNAVPCCAFALVKLERREQKDFKERKQGVATYRALDVVRNVLEGDWQGFVKRILGCVTYFLDVELLHGFLC